MTGNAHRKATNQIPLLIHEAECPGGDFSYPPARINSRGCLSVADADRDLAAFDPKDAILLAMERELVEGEDYYREGPYVVFTQSFLRRRGWCCESGCRHCPWGYRSDRRSNAPVPPAGEDEEKG